MRKHTLFAVAGIVLTLVFLKTKEFFEFSKIQIKQSILEIHEAYCFRNRTKCEKCGVLIDKTELQSHDEASHSLVYIINFIYSFDLRYYYQQSFLFFINMDIVDIYIYKNIYIYMRLDYNNHLYNV